LPALRAGVDVSTGEPLTHGHAFEAVKPCNEEALGISNTY